MSGYTGQLKYLPRFADYLFFMFTYWAALILASIVFTNRRDLSDLINVSSIDICIIAEILAEMDTAVYYIVYYIVYYDD